MANNFVNQILFLVKLLVLASFLRPNHIVLISMTVVGLSVLVISIVDVDFIERLGKLHF